MKKRLLAWLLGISIFTFILTYTSTEYIVYATGNATQDSIPPSSGTGEIILGLIEIVALALPAIAIFMQVLLEYSNEAESSVRSGGIGSLNAEEYREIVLAVGFIAVFFPISSLSAMVSLLETPQTLDWAHFPLLFGLMIIPYLMLYVIYQKLRYD